MPSELCGESSAMGVRVVVATTVRASVVPRSAMVPAPGTKIDRPAGAKPKRSA